MAEILPEAIALAEKIDDRTGLALALSYTAHTSIELFDVAQAIKSGHRSLAIAEEIGDRVLIDNANNYLLGIYYTLGDYKRAIDFGLSPARASEEVVAEFSERNLLPLIPWFLPQAYAEIGRFAEAVSLGNALMRRAEAAGHPFTIVGMAIGMGFTYMRWGGAGDALPYLERSLKLCRTYALDNWVPWTASTLGLAYALAGRHSEGIESAQEAVKRGNELRLTRFQPLRMTMLANAYLQAGRYEEALAAARDAHELARRFHERGPEAWAFYLIAASIAQSQRGERNESFDSYFSGLKAADALGMRPLVAHCHLGLGMLCRQTNKREQAREHLITASKLYRDMGMQFWPEQAESEIRELA